jgi:seryl-tRNA(Sec) selenium transferase
MPLDFHALAAVKAAKAANQRMNLAALPLIAGRRVSRVAGTDCPLCGARAAKVANWRRLAADG